eukprot:CAMPEP_0185038212 /NCGR_PEP_ID=MMETSP1103-20130426/33603_1 /TAXON_ID=36769 /ORGANISM="Paraphysomonas bandaiensis, Strain Caron Lab Isolate" /LENGTH=483 /DNA_ID=CAMNT_0027576543 /DNA_START=129 /DNA_END=1580 /DNA_ORIENTATION=-
MTMHSLMESISTSCRMLESQHQLLVDCIEWIGVHQSNGKLVEEKLSQCDDMGSDDITLDLINYSEDVCKSVEFFHQGYMECKNCEEDLDDCLVKLETCKETLDIMWQGQRKALFNNDEVNGKTRSIAMLHTKLETYLGRISDAEDRNVRPGYTRSGKLRIVDPPPKSLGKRTRALSRRAKEDATRFVEEDDSDFEPEEVRKSNRPCIRRNQVEECDSEYEVCDSKRRTSGKRRKSSSSNLEISNNEPTRRSVRSRSLSALGECSEASNDRDQVVYDVEDVDDDHDKSGRPATESISESNSSTRYHQDEYFSEDSDGNNSCQASVKHSSGVCKEGSSDQDRVTYNADDVEDDEEKFVYLRQPTASLATPPDSPTDAEKKKYRSYSNDEASRLSVQCSQSQQECDRDDSTGVDLSMTEPKAGECGEQSPRSMSDSDGDEYQKTKYSLQESGVSVVDGVADLQQHHEINEDERNISSGHVLVDLTD